MGAFREFYFLPFNPTYRESKIKKTVLKAIQNTPSAIF